MTLNPGNHPARRTLFLVAIVVLATMVLSIAMSQALPVAAQGRAADLTLTGLPDTVSKGDRVVVSVDLAGVVGGYALDARLVFDPEVLQVVDQDLRKEGIQVEPGSLLQPDFVVRNVADNITGTIMLAMTQLNPRQPVDGYGSAMRVVFEAVASGKPTVQVVAFALAQRDGVLFPVSLGVWAATPEALPGQQADPAALPPTTVAPSVVATRKLSAVPTTVAPAVQAAQAPATLTPVEPPVQAAFSGMATLIAVAALGLAAVALWLIKRSGPRA